MNEANLDLIGKRLGDIRELPESIRKLLNATKLDPLEEKIVETTQRMFNGTANVDEIIVGLYRMHSYVAESRQKIANKLYRMTKAGTLESVEGRKGVYRVK